MIRYGSITIDRAQHAIWHGRHFHQFTMQATARFPLLCALILCKPQNRDELFELVYKNRADGGPILEGKHIEVLIAQLKPIFEKLHLQLIRERKNGCIHYQVVPK
jgi:hypothetical protein